MLEKLFPFYLVAWAILFVCNEILRRRLAPSVKRKWYPRFLLIAVLALGGFSTVMALPDWTWVAIFGAVTALVAYVAFNLKICVSCGAVITVDLSSAVRFCPRCGADVQ
jgi:hypothetical protein